jgi:hypothetical protein
MAAPAAQRLLDWLYAPPERGCPEPARSTPAEWEELFNEAYRHRVTPQLYRRLRAEAIAPFVPPDGLRALRLGVARQMADTARLQRELVAVLRCLRGVGITPILLKGTHLATAVFPEPLLRGMVDFDLLFRRAELAAAEDALCADGYRTPRTVSIDEICAHEHHIPRLRREGRMYVLELHWTLVPPDDGLPIDPADFWSRAQPVTVFGEPALVLAPEDALLHVCLHAAVHHLFDHGIRPLVDVAALVDRYGATIDWAAVESRARAWGIEHGVYLLLELARRDAGVAVPADFLGRLQPRDVPPAVLEAARAQMFEVPARLPGHARTHSVAMAVTRPRFVWEYVFCSRADLMRHYDLPEHTRHVWRYYAVRLKDLVQRYAGVAWNVLRRERWLLTAAPERMHREMVLQEWLERART